jgi:hypothetical protein
MSVRTRLRGLRILPRILVAALAAIALVFANATAAQADPADQTVSFTSPPPAPARYGGTYQPSASASSGLPVTISVAASSIGCTLSSGTVTFVSVGTCVLDAVQPGNDNFNPASAQQSFAIDPAPLTLSVSGSQTYGGTSTGYLVGDIQGFQFSDDVSVIQGTLNCTSGVTSGTPVGSYPITHCSGLSAPNYTIVYDLGTVTVRPAQLTITASSATFTYGTNPPAITASYSGFVNGDAATDLATHPTCSTTATSSSNVGSYPSSCSGAAAANYTIGYGTGVVTVTRASLVITASNGSFTFGGNPPAVTPSYAGFVNGDTDADLTAPPTCSTTATASSPVGSYTTTCAGAASKNYTIAYQTGTMIVKKAVLTITASSATVAFGDEIPAITPSYNGFVNGDTEFSLAVRPTCSTTATSTSPVGDYPTTCSGAVGANYDINYVHGMLTVAKAVLTVTASSATIAYGSTPPQITPFYDGFLNGDTPAELTTQPTCGTAVTAATPVGTYATSCAGGASANYTLVYADGTLTVKKAVLTVTGRDVSRPMGAANTFEYVLSGFVNGDGPAAVSGQPAFGTTANAASEPGLYPIFVSTGTLSAANYSFAFVTGWLTVTKGTPKLVAATVSRSASLHTGKMTFSATATNSISGAPIAGVTMTFKVVTQFGGVVTCSGVTNSVGTASCSSGDGRLLLLPIPWTYSITFAGNFDYLAGSGTGSITA